jgi:hypothetical protein
MPVAARWNLSCLSGPKVALTHHEFAAQSLKEVNLAAKAIRKERERNGDVQA